MNISEATKHLANTLRDHFIAVAPQDSAVQFLEQVSRICEFRDQDNLDAWETAVLSVFTDTEWDEFENREDFNLLERVWEVGRYNLYGAIVENATRRLFQKVSQDVRKITGIVTLNADQFDFSEW